MKRYFSVFGSSSSSNKDGNLEKKSTYGRD
jgi:hypothetical protein